MPLFQTSQNGNILFIILIAVALFAALCYVISDSMRGGSSGGSANEKSLISSSEITQYASAVENAVMYLKVSKNCTLEEISFERPPFDGSDTDYVNGASPDDYSCHVFHTTGGRISVQPAPTGANDGSDWAYVQRTVMEIGPDQTSCGEECNEILAVLGGVNESTCKTLNKKIAGTEEIPEQAQGTDYDNPKYEGRFSISDVIGEAAAGHSRMCIKDANGKYFYYHVLAPR